LQYVSPSVTGTNFQFYQMEIPLMADTETRTPALGPLEIYNASVAAVNAGDADAAAAFFADDATLTTAPHALDPSGVALAGKPQIAAMLQAATAGAMTIVAQGEAQVSGDTLTRREIHTAGALLPKDTSLEVEVTVVVRQGRIRSLNITTPEEDSARRQQVT
jgi:ketosteroid isomerase-like protein